jgi:transcriptional regulator with XRE-family HTH domain
VAGRGTNGANVTIHNISAAGLLIETGLDLAEGEQLALDLPQAGAVTAVVVWRSERLFGCAFADALGPAAMAAVQLLAPPSAFAPAARLAAPQTRPGETLGGRLNRLRREAGMTLADVAAALAVSKPTVWAWEKGKARPLPERLDAIAAALGVAPETLLPTLEPVGEIGAVIEECRTRIAEASGAGRNAVRIMIEL